MKLKAGCCSPVRDLQQSPYKVLHIPHQGALTTLTKFGLLKTNLKAHTSIIKVNNQQGLTVQHRKLCSLLCNNLNGKII